MAISAKRRVFIEEYLRCWNGSEAARRAGYKRPGREAYRLLKIDEIHQAVQDRIAEKAMGADEVLLRLAEQARGEATAYLLDDGTVDLERLLADGKGHLVKGTKWDRAGNLVIEFYDAQSALVNLGRHHGLFTDKEEIDGGIEVVVKHVQEDRNSSPGAASGSGEGSQ